LLGFHGTAAIEQVAISGFDWAAESFAAVSRIGDKSRCPVTTKSEQVNTNLPAQLHP
jgi:hypothetical protein